MGTVIPFPDAWRLPGKRAHGTVVEPATVTILPVIRIERHEDEAAAQQKPVRRRRRRRATPA